MGPGHVLLPAEPQQRILNGIIERPMAEQEKTGKSGPPLHGLCSFCIGTVKFPNLHTKEL